MLPYKTPLIKKSRKLNIIHQNYIRIHTCNDIQNVNKPHFLNLNYLLKWSIFSLTKSIGKYNSFIQYKIEFSQFSILINLINYCIIDLILLIIFIEAMLRSNIYLHVAQYYTDVILLGIHTSLPLLYLLVWRCLGSPYILTLQARNTT